jgi:hypothetical protein
MTGENSGKIFYGKMGGGGFNPKRRNLLHEIETKTKVVDKSKIPKLKMEATERWWVGVLGWECHFVRCESGTNFQYELDSLLASQHKPVTP